MSEEIYRRLNKLEKTDEDTRMALNQLVINTSIMNENLTKLSSLEPRVRQIEDDQATSKVILTSIRWVGTIIVGTAMTVITAAVITQYLGAT